MISAHPENSTSTHGLILNIEEACMSGKDAKLAAARKRAEALKSKKASSINLQVKTDESDSSNDLVRPIEGEDVHTEVSSSF